MCGQSCSQTSGKGVDALVQIQEMLYHITGIVHIERPAAYVAVSKLYYKIQQERSVFFELHG